MLLTETRSFPQTVTELEDEVGAFISDADDPSADWDTLRSSASQIHDLLAESHHKFVQISHVYMVDPSDTIRLSKAFVETIAVLLHHTDDVSEEIVIALGKYKNAAVKRVERLIELQQKRDREPKENPLDSLDDILNT